MERLAGAELTWEPLINPSLLLTRQSGTRFQRLNWGARLPQHSLIHTDSALEPIFPPALTVISA